MGRKPIDCKLILELLDKGQSMRTIGKTRHIATRSVRMVKESAEEKGVTWDDVKGMGDMEVYDLIFPARAESGEGIAEVDYDYVHTELMRDGVTLKLLWEEYVDTAEQSGLVPKSYATFCRGYSFHIDSSSLTNHLEHKPGQTMEVDWNGTTMRLVDAYTGEVSKAHLFVATLPYSQYSYVEATLDTRQNTWLLCHVHAWDFFGGVAVRTVCDNLKTGVTKHPKEGEIVPDKAYEALGEHYMTAIMPTGVRKPKEKASVEGTCGKVATAIVAKLRNRTFHAVEQLNEAIMEKLADSDERPFQKREGSRLSVFQDVEQSFLGPLPALPFDVCDWVYGRKVRNNCHVTFERNNYSVPFQYVGKTVDIRYTSKSVDVYLAGARIASHVRFSENDRYQYRTDPSHMPPEFQRSEWDDVRIKKWARSIGPNTLGVVTRLFDRVQIKEQAYDSALAVLNLTKHYSDRELEDACAYALSRQTYPRCRFIKSVLASGRGKGCSSEAKRQEKAERESSSGFLRGAAYYASGGGAR